ncbi:hypothetical protein HaLaN_31314 [Haematococcus lacustris]|uniref:Uncharacterized protein n=1 Tax=Haematococcus lacustris TaxID=44745 RepID=A0A6A0AHU3_HAELA|nr:hypothetical protein HaLaN_31314 [Haematococcus lacustris]
MSEAIVGLIPPAYDYDEEDRDGDDRFPPTLRSRSCVSHLPCPFVPRSCCKCGAGPVAAVDFPTVIPAGAGRRHGACAPGLLVGHENDGTQGTVAARADGDGALEQVGGQDALCGTELMACQAQRQLDQTVTACWSRCAGLGTRKISLEAFVR